LILLKKVSTCPLRAGEPPPKRCLEDAKMAEKFWLSKEAFLKIAEVSRLDTTDRHMEELYAFVQQMLPGIRDIEALDLTGMEPFMPSLSAKGNSK
jgi:hypothetical protein